MVWPLGAGRASTGAVPPLRILAFACADTWAPWLQRAARNLAAFAAAFATRRLLRSMVAQWRKYRVLARWQRRQWRVAEVRARTRLPSARRAPASGVAASLAAARRLQEYHTLRLTSRVARAWVAFARARAAEHARWCIALRLPPGSVRVCGSAIVAATVAANAAASAGTAACSCSVRCAGLARPAGSRAGALGAVRVAPARPVHALPQAARAGAGAAWLAWRCLGAGAPSVTGAASQGGTHSCRPPAPRCLQARLRCLCRLAILLHRFRLLSRCMRAWHARAARRAAAGGEPPSVLQRLAARGRGGARLAALRGRFSARALRPVAHAVARALRDAASSPASHGLSPTGSGAADNGAAGHGTPGSISPLRYSGTGAVAARQRGAGGVSSAGGGRASGHRDAAALLTVRRGRMQPAAPQTLTWHLP